MRMNIIVVLTSALLLTACKKESPLGPETEGPSPATETKIIGPAGGSIATTGFLLTVPQGAFAAQETLKISVEQGNSDFGSWMLSAAFKVEGLPADYAHPLRLKLTCQRPPATGTFVALGRRATSLNTGADDIIYRPIPAKDSSGFLVADLPNQETGNRMNALQRSSGTSGTLESFLWLAAVDQQDTMKSLQGHFRIFYPKYLEGKVTSLAGYLEEAYTKYDQMGFNKSTYETADWPVPVSVKKFSQTDIGVLGNFLLLIRDAGNRPLWGMRFNEEMILSTASSVTRIVAARLFSNVFFIHRDHFFWVPHTQEQYDHQANRIWPYYAIACWAEEKFVPPSEQSSFSPLSFQGLESRPLKGISALTGESVETQGTAMACLIKYLAGTYSESLPPTLSDNIPSSTHAADALITTIPDGPDVWWPGFLKEYISGGIYNVLSDSLLKQFNNTANPDQFTIALPSDTAKHFSASYPDLSARLYKVNLRYAGIGDKTWLQFALGPNDLNFKYVGVMLFGLKDKKLEYWGFGKELKLENIKALTAAGYDIVAAVVNSTNAPPYDGSRSIELTVRINGGTSGIPLQAGFTEKIYCTFTDKNSLTTYGFAPYLSPYSATRNGILTERTFTASWNGPWSGTGNRTASGNLVLSFDNSSPPHMVGFSMRDTVSGEGETYVWRMMSSTNCNIPGVLDYDRYVFQLSGTAIKDQLGTFAYSYDRDTGYWIRLVSANPREGDFIYITVQKW